MRQLAAKLDTMRHDIYNGRGFGLVRGLDVNKFSLEDLTTIYLGVQIHIGNKFGRQDKKGNMLGALRPRYENCRRLANLNSSYCGQRLL